MPSCSRGTNSNKFHKNQEGLQKHSTFPRDFLFIPGGIAAAAGGIWRGIVVDEKAGKFMGCVGVGTAADI